MFVLGVVMLFWVWLCLFGCRNVVDGDVGGCALRGYNEGVVKKSGCG